jgi:hypothetical protein
MKCSLTFGVDTLVAFHMNINHVSIIVVVKWVVVVIAIEIPSSESSLELLEEPRTMPRDLPSAKKPSTAVASTLRASVLSRRWTFVDFHGRLGSIGVEGAFLWRRWTGATTVSHVTDAP